MLLCLVFSVLDTFYCGLSTSAWSGAAKISGDGALLVSILELGVRTRTLVTRKCNVITLL